MAIAITIYFEGIRQLNSFYNQFMNDSLASFEDHSPMGSNLRNITDKIFRIRSCLFYQVNLQMNSGLCRRPTYLTLTVLFNSSCLLLITRDLITCRHKGSHYLLYLYYFCLDCILYFVFWHPFVA